MHELNFFSAEKKNRKIEKSKNRKIEKSKKKLSRETKLAQISLPLSFQRPQLVLAPNNLFYFSFHSSFLTSQHIFMVKQTVFHFGHFFSYASPPFSYSITRWMFILLTSFDM